RSKADVLRGAVGHQQGTQRKSRGADGSADEDRAPAARGHVEEEERQRQELEPDGGREEDARGDGAIAKAPCGEREGERDEVHVAERHLEDEAQEEDITGGGPRTP